MCRAVTRAVGLEPKMPALPPPPPPPAPVLPAAQPVAERMAEVDTGAQDAERRRARAAAGRSSTILTGGLGDQSAPVLARPMAGARTLLG